MGRAIAASILSLATALGVTSCSNDYTVAYVYMTTAKTLPHGLINAYQVDYQSGNLYTLADSPIDAGGRNTVGLVATSDHLALYTVNRDDSSVVQFAIGTDGKLYPENTYKITGSFATAAAIDAQGKFLYVTFTYQNSSTGQQLYTPANPGPGGVAIFPIYGKPAATTDPPQYSLGTPTTFNLGRNPMGILTSPKNNFVYVIEQDSATTANLLGFSENPSNGALTALPGVTINPGNTVSPGFTVGISPDGLIEDATATHLYVADSVANTVSYYTIGSNGVPALNGTVATDSGPAGMTFDLSGKYLYVVNYISNTVNGFNIGSTGVPVRSSVSSSTQTGTGPTCVSVVGAPSSANPTHGIYMYIANALTNNVTAEQLNPADGSLVQIKGSPFGGSTLPSCLVTVPALPIRG